MVYQWRNFTRALEYITPAVCLLCTTRVCGPGILCDECRGDLPQAHQHSFGPTPLPDRRRAGVAAIDRIIYTYAYKYPLTELIRQLKYKQNTVIAGELGRELAKTVLTVSTSLPDCIIPVPLHRLRYIGRGYNQALEIAQVVGRELSVAVNGNVVERTRITRAQFTLGPSARRRNLRGAFKLSLRPCFESVAIVDDIITTGATVLEMARLLRLAGVKRVEAWACAGA